MRHLPLLALLALAACDAGVDRRVALQSLVGQPETELVRQQGVPTRSYETGGRKFLAYDEQRADLLPGPFFGGYGYGAASGFGYGGFGFPPTLVERFCETTFEIAGGRVASWSLRGNACG